MKPKRNTMQKDILFIFISSFIVVAAWISFNIYHIYATSTVSQDIQSDLTPISPVFDPVTMNQLKTRENVEPLYKIQKSTLSPASSDQFTQPSPTPPVSGTPQSTDVTAQNGTAASAASQLAPLNSPINRVGQ